MTKIRFRWRGDRHIEKDILDGMEGGDINSREELMKIAEEEGLIGEVINWSRWDEVVQQTKELIHQLVEDDDDDYTPGTFKPVYAYDLLNNGKLIGEFSSAQEASEALGVNKGTIAHYACLQKPYITGHMYFSYTPLVKQEVLQYKPRLNTNYNGGKPVEKYVYSLDGKLLGHYSSTQEVADKYGIPPKQVNYLAWKKRPYWLKNIIILNGPMNDKSKRLFREEATRKGRT